VKAARLAPTLVLALLCGCLERKEEIEVAPDGGVRIVHEVHGDGADLDGGAARYPDGGPWAAERSTRTKRDGKVEHVLTAEAAFEAGAVLPGSFAPDGAAEGPGALRFPTEVTVRREPGRTVYVFARTYRARRWAPYQRVWDEAFPEEVRALFEDAGDLEAMAPADRRRLLEAVIAWERGKAEAWADDALVATAAGADRLPEARLAVRSAVAGYFAERVAPEDVEALLGAPKARIEARARAVEADLDRLAVERATDVLGLPAADGVRLAEAIAARRRAFAVTEDLGDEAFRVRLRLPGRVVRHDGDAVEGGAVVWRFDGKALRDREHSLLAVSVVEDGD